MKNITKVILLICMIAEAENAFAQWSFSMSFSYVGRDCGFMPELQSIEATVNQMLKSSQVQYPTRDQCMAERSMVQSILNEVINTYSYGLTDCRIVFSLGGCTGSDMENSTLQLGVSKDAVFQSSNPANEVNDWVAMHDSLMAIFGNPSRNQESLDQTAHINDFIDGLDQIEHVGTSYAKPSVNYIPDSIKDNYGLATWHEAPSFDWDNVYNKKEEVIIAKPLPKPKLHWEDYSDYEPVSYDIKGESPDVEDWIDAAGDVAKNAFDVASIVAEGVGVGTVLLADVTINVLVEDAKALYKGVWEGEIVSTKEILTNAAKNTLVGNLFDHSGETPDAGDLIETAVHTGMGEAMGKAIGLAEKKNPIGSLLSIGTRTAKYIGKAIGESW